MRNIPHRALRQLQLFVLIWAKAIPSVTVQLRSTPPPLQFPAGSCFEIPFGGLILNISYWLKIRTFLNTDIGWWRGELIKNLI